MKNKIKVFEMFAGYGGASFGLKKAGIDYENIGFSEIDKYAIQCYNQNHKGENFGDCTKINPNELPNFDLLTGGFPCQSFSIAGKGLGELDTRGTLFNEIIRIAEVKQPKYMLLENVKGLTNKRHIKTFNKILSELKRIGYIVHWKVLNSKDYGIPQNRERVFFVCFRELRDALDFEFPKKEELRIFLKDILEDNPNYKYYLTEKQLNGMINWKAQEKPLTTLNNTISKCLRARGQSDLHSGLQLVNATKKGYLNAFLGDGISLEYPKSKTRRGRVQSQISPTLQCFNNNGVVVKNSTKNKLMTVNIKNEIIKNIPSIGQAKRVYSINGISPSLNIGWVPNINNIKEYTNFFIFPRKSDGKLINSSYNRVWHKNYVGTLSVSNPLNILDTNLRIRKLTHKECFRLMGFLDDKINLDNLSDTKKSKLAGNGWDINLVSKIFKEMFKR